MAFLIGGANSAADTGYDVDNSCRFNAGDSAYMTRTFGSAGNRRTWTFSTWCKRAKFGAQQTLFGSSADGSNYHLFYWGSDETLTHNFSGTTTSAPGYFRDPGAWMHVVCAVDTTQSTAANRVKLYVNGSSVGSGSYPDEDAEMILNNNVRCDVGSSGAHFTSHMLGGYLAETVFIDGTQYAASDFGEYDSDSPTIWKPKDVSGLTFGTNGFWFDYKASGTLGNDANGGTDWTATNLAAADQATATPSNNFATLNPLVTINGSTFSEGNCKIVTGSSPYSYDVSTIAVTNGKWYVEAQYGGDSDDATFGIAGRLATATTHELGQYNDTWSYYTGTGASNIRNNDSNSSYGNTYAADDIIGLAVDLTNNKLYFSKNGTWQNSGDPESGSTGTGAVSITAAASVTDGVYFIGVGDFDGGASVTWLMNFGGCPAYAISSGNADANGYGNFEYAVPEGYFSLNTKNLAEYG